MQEMLDNEDCDAIFEPSCIVEYEASNPKNCDSSDTAKYTHQAGERVYNMNFAAGVSLSRPGVARALSSIISCLRSEGFFDDLYEKYFEQRGCKNSLEKYNRGQGALQYQHFLGLFVFVFIASLVLMATARDLPWMGGRHVTVSPARRDDSAEHYFFRLGALLFTATATAWIFIPARCFVPFHDRTPPNAPACRSRCSASTPRTRCG